LFQPEKFYLILRIISYVDKIEFAVIEINQNDEITGDQVEFFACQGFKQDYKWIVEASKVNELMKEHNEAINSHVNESLGIFFS
jgi:hypothetical protein